MFMNEVSAQPHDGILMRDRLLSPESMDIVANPLSNY
jgi:hypothetical protein